MKQSVLFVLAAAMAIAVAAPVDDQVSSTTPNTLLRSAADGPNPDGSYNFSYETNDGTKAEEHGAFHPVEQQRSVAEGEEQGPSEALEAQGAFSYVGPDGVTYSVRYVANENGFQPEGEHLPVAPAIPEGIARALKWIQEHPEENNYGEQQQQPEQPQQ